MRPMTHDRFTEFRDLHYATFNQYEFTSNLGHDYLTLFYDYLLSCGTAFGFYCEVGGEIVSYSVGYLNRDLFFKNFHREHRFRLLLIWLRKIWDMPHAYIIGGICQLLFGITDKKTRKVRDHRAHLGFIVLRKDYQGTPEGREMVVSCIQAVMDEHKHLGYKGTWGGVDSRNPKMGGLLKKLGFAEVDRLSFPGRDIIIFDIGY